MDTLSDNMLLIQASFISILICPAVWNTIGFVEYKTKSISRLFGSNLRGVYFTALVATITSRTRDILFIYASYKTMNTAEIPHQTSLFLGLLLGIIGAVLVFTSGYKLGVIGTYMGDHFGIFLPAKLTSFPFNVLDNPMYVGSSLAMLGWAFLMRSKIGLVMAVFASSQARPGSFISALSVSLWLGVSLVTRQKSTASP